MRDVVVGYPTAERAALRTLAGDPRRAARVTLMIDDVAGLDLVRAAVADVADRAELRVALDLDASLRTLGDRVHLGPRRSPVHTVADAVALARAVADDPAFRLVGLMAYEGQVAGLGDRPTNPLRGAAVRRVKAASVAELTERRGAVVTALREVADLEFVNGGGTGSIETTVADPSVTEVAAGSGLFAPTLFDGYDAFEPTPAALFGLAVARRPGPGLVTVTGGGWIASGPVGRDRVPVPDVPTPGCGCWPPRAPARYRPPCAATPPTACGSVTGCGSGTPRPASCASGSTRCTWCRATRSSTPCRRTAAKAAPSSRREAVHIGIPCATRVVAIVTVR